MSTENLIVLLVVACVLMLAVILFMIWLLRRLVTGFLERNMRR